MPGLPTVLFALALLLPQPEAADELIDQARKLRRAGRAAEAITLLEQARAGRAADAELEGLLGTLLLDAGQVGRARELAAGLSDHDGSSYRALVFLGRYAEEEEDDLERALGAYRRATPLRPRPTDALKGQLSVFLARAQFGKAAKRAETIQAYDPAVGQQLLGDVYLAQGDHLRQGGAEMLPIAASRYRMALLQRPTDLLIVRRLLEVLVLSLHLEEAGDINAAAFAAEAHAAERLFWEGRIHESARQVDDARAAYRASYAARPDNGTTCLHLARLALSDGHGETAKEWLELAVAHMGESPRSLLLKAEVHNGLGQADQALSCLRRAVSLDRRSAGAHYQLALTLLKLGRREEGKAAMATFRAIQDAARPPVDEG